MRTRGKSSKPLPHKCNAEATSYIDLCLERLREQGGRISGARLNVIHTLAKADRPLVPKEILVRAQKVSEGASLDLVSVYRNLEALVEKGLVHQIGHHGAYFPCLHSDCGTKVHVLTHCESCQRTQELHIPESLNGMVKALIALNSKAMARISSFQVEGLCSKCAKRA